MYQSLLGNKCYIFVVCVYFFLSSCTGEKIQKPIPNSLVTVLKKQDLTTKELENWHTMDYEKDTIPGTSLDRTFKKLINQRQGNSIVIALLDMPINIQHKHLKHKIWQNKNEIPNNSIDDDGNGYIDDFNGWNFLGGTDKNKNSSFVNYEYTRILKKHSSTEQQKRLSEQERYIYQKAKKAHEQRLKSTKLEIENFESFYRYYQSVASSLAPFFENQEFEIYKLDSLNEVYSQDTSITHSIAIIKELVHQNFTKKLLEERKLKLNERFNKLLNTQYNDRTIIGDNPDDIFDSIYGNNLVDFNTNLLDHGTLTAGILGTSQINNIKIMPICVSAYGDEHDKDIALAIRYAVNNGARVINISFGKSFSLHPEWVLDAIKYADQKDVLIVTSSGNNGLNLDQKDNYNYPNDSVSTYQEVSNNFLKVASSGYKLDSTFVHPATNYGKEQVDIFAPGEKIFTYSAKKEGNSEYTSGTSAASAIVSKIAALLRLYYPELSAPEVKQILMKSGVSYDIMVNISKDPENEELVPFSSLSKSGKVVNAYNALLMAEQVSKGKLIL